MNGWSLSQVATEINAQRLGDGSVCPSTLSMDTRTLQPNSCFVAIRAERDGHEFASTAVEKGASCLLVDHALDISVAQLVVPDTLKALQAWAHARLKWVAPKAVMGVTGSVGKTSTKELLAGATQGWKTPGNRNNTLGLPEALATLPKNTDCVVLEMGMSTPGEIRCLTGIAPLDFGLITVVGKSHMENFPDGQKGIARAKGELVEGLKQGGLWVYHAEDPWCQWIAQADFARHTRPLAVGKGQRYDVGGIESLGAFGERFRLKTPKGELELTLSLPGHHQVQNAALAATLALEAGFDPDQIARGLALVKPEVGRGRLHQRKGGGWLLDESYNASPDSMLACTGALLELPGESHGAVLGSMRELGPESEKLHRETGAALRQAGLNALWTFGEYAKAMAEGFGQGAQAFPDFEALKDDPQGLSQIPDGMSLLVKASRFYRSERVVAWLSERP